MMIKPITTTLAALALGGLLGACGGSGDDGGSGSSEEAGGEDPGQELFDWVECMNGEGVELPEPTRDADGDLVITGNGVNMGGTPGEASFGENSEEDVRAATDVCGPPPLRADGVLSDESQQEEQEMLLEYSQCMRENGVEDFPDPDPTPEENDGVISPFPPLEDGDTEAEAAAEACEEVMTGGGGEPAEG